MPRSRKLQFGAYDTPAPGWVNTDVTPQLMVARVPGLPALLHRLGRISDARLEAHRRGVFRALSYLDVSRPFPFPDDSFEAAYSSHVLEHLLPGDARNCVRELRRVLAPGGVVRLAVPDLDQLVASYDAADPEPFLEGIYQGRTARDNARHWWHYSEASLTRLLEEEGFVRARRRGYREGECPDVETIETRPGSLIVEARVPDGAA